VGCFFSADLGCLGLCLDEWLIYICVGGLLAVFEVILCGRWCLRVCCDVYGENEMTSFEDYKRMLVEIKAVFFCTMYL
jgi:hypothetical protein